MTVSTQLQSLYLWNFLRRAFIYFYSCLWYLYTCCYVFHDAMRVGHTPDGWSSSMVVLSVDWNGKLLTFIHSPVQHLSKCFSVMSVLFFFFLLYIERQCLAVLRLLACAPVRLFWRCGQGYSVHFYAIANLSCFAFTNPSLVYMEGIYCLTHTHNHLALISGKLLVCAGAMLDSKD